MSSYGLVAVFLLVCTWAFSEAQMSCKGRCGIEYYRGRTCQCDYSCLVYGECCKDFEKLCTSKSSCRGRCGETFKRGRTCECDSECVKYKKCCPDYEDHCTETDPIPESGEETEHIEGSDPGYNFIPTVTPTSYPKDDPGSASKQVSEVQGPEPSPPTEGASGFGSTPSDPLEDSTTGPPIPDLDGFEILPETITASTAPKEEATQSPTTVIPSTAEVTTNTDADDSSNAPESIEVELWSSQAPTEAAPLPTDDQTTTAQTAPAEMNENPTSAPTVPPSEMPETTLASEESTVTVYSASPVAENTEVTTIVPTTINQETTAAPEITTASADPSTLAPEVAEVSTISSTNSEEADATTVELPDVEEISTASPTSKPETEKPSEPVQDPENPEDVDATTVELPDVMEISTAAPTSKPETEKPDPEKPNEPALEEVDATTVEVPDVSPSSTAAPTSKPKPEKPIKPSLDPDNKPVLNGLGDSAEYPADDSNDTDLCSGRPISGVTSLSNGTLVVFRGHFFWVLDRNRVPGPAQSITQVWGVPSPIDTVFTRCNCQAKTYIFKGSLYWRFENAVLDPGFPQRIDKGFDGLRGQVTAALSMPQHRNRMESVYFFRRVVSLGPSIKYKTSWRGFPATITAAVSIPNRSEPEGYGYYVFSRSKSYKIQLEEDRPVIATPKPSSSPQNYEVFKCPKKVSK